VRKGWAVTLEGNEGNGLREQSLRRPCARWRKGIRVSAPNTARNPRIESNRAVRAGKRAERLVLNINLLSSVRGQE
jgi:hypothetical protein